MVSIELPDHGKEGRALSWIRRKIQQGLARPAPRKGTRPRLSPVTRGGFTIWVPFWLSLGIGLWFWLPADPGPVSYGVGTGAVLLCLALHAAARRLAEAGRLDWARADILRIASLALALVLGGFLCAGLRSAAVAAPVLEFRYYGPIEGRVIDIDRSSRDRIRLFLDEVQLKDTPPERTPDKVRISFMTVPDLPMPGERVMLTGHLGPPPGPSEPDDFDFRRNAWFEGIGAIGYSRTPVMTVTEAVPGGVLAMLRIRMRLSALMQGEIGGQSGAVASALITGDRSGISEATNEVMRISSLYHIISISGLHMSMLAAFSYGAIRLIGVSAIALGGSLLWPLHKIAAIGAIVIATAYLLLSGGGVATERSYLMVLVMLCAILVNRRAISLRTVALAAIAVLLKGPEALTSPSFQMSFAATVALVIGHGYWSRVSGYVPMIFHQPAMLLLTSLVASMATGPIAAAHFGRIAPYGILANLLAVPIVGTIVMPMGVISVILAPFGLAGPALWLMGLGTSWMLDIAEAIAGLKGADLIVAAPPSNVLPLIGSGMMLAALLGPQMRKPSGLMRKLAIFSLPASLLVVGSVLWISSKRPEVLISADGTAIGIRGGAGRVPSKPSGGSFSVENWLHNDGEAVSQKTAAARDLWSGPANARDARAGPDANPIAVIHLTGKGAAEALPQRCKAATVIVSDQLLTGSGPVRGPCFLLDRRRLDRTGALALFRQGDSYRVVSTTVVHGRRPWNRPRVAPAERLAAELTTYLTPPLSAQR
ncbi:ComEC/Rec2 family competence protein [Paracoccus aminophilus]|uniref:Competence protein ComEC n=1 Tax=Paracoccus aminophilus JCM 7686 TaxID=1367847 RepID=S5XPX2_PARAH|nr:ComEC/Rec2 family competence protein [Paracoccus aminophilus]AGT09409.1 competence protein ComEC [Paracoccus aminophilus JCM 7686]